MKHYSSYFFLLISACVPIQTTYTPSTSSSTTISYIDKIYTSTIKTVQLYPSIGRDIEDQTETPVITILDNNLVLEFDDLVENGTSYKAKIINCTANWEKSAINAIEYLHEYNEFDIFEYQYSLDTDFPFVHYQFNVPRVKLPGNYLLMVYKNGNEILFTKRFMVYDNRIDVFLAKALNGYTNLSRKNQKIEFFLNYKNYPITNPRESVNVQIRQNYRWDNVMHGIQPAFIREDIKELEYRFINNADLFKGGNEFRFFDFRSIKYPGYRIQKIERYNNQFHVNIASDKVRSDLAYSQYRDNNGNFFIFNQDFINSSTSSNYAKVNFSLSDEKIPDHSNIYLSGAFTNYELSQQYLLTHNETKKMYEIELLLKQGHYDYQYYLANDSIDNNYIEGDYFETENSYEILVYHRPFGAKTDLLIGYKSL
ncbi:MAG: DUF5103 domain-containing protein [Cyclobacteriaceae bacterium]|nr:DUF5103 domain-containing protein [Cyclobacteriaceae bacterium]